MNVKEYPMPSPRDSEIQWRKSSRSNGTQVCVELAGTLDLVRDSKNPAGPVLAVDLQGLLAAIKSNQFGL